MITVVHFDEAMMHVMQFSLVISGWTGCSNAFSAFRFNSQGRIITLIRWGGWNSHHHMCRSF